MKAFRRLLLLTPFVLMKTVLVAQNYQAIHGSSFAGSLAPSFNPSSIVQVPYSWDVTLFALQFKNATNGIKINNYSYLSKADNTDIKVLDGEKRRLAYANQNIRLLNTRIALNPYAAFAFGMNVRSYVSIQTSRFNWNDSMGTVHDFGVANTSNTPLSAKVIGASWAEIYGTYAQTIKDYGNSIINAGITIKINRGLAAAYGKAEDLNYTADVNNNYLLTEGSLEYGYSSNLDDVNSNNDFSTNRKKFLRKTFSTLGADLGMEYIKFADDGNDYNYDTKIGVSILDIGRLKFGYGSRSRLVIAGKTNISDSLLQATFVNVNSFDAINDSLAKVANSITTPGGYFFMSLPTRLMVNVDKHFTGNFFLNAELSLPLTPPGVKDRLYIKDMNLLAITPRYENRFFGFYLPMQVNTIGQFWIGGALKAGPVLLGVHNWANLFAKNSTQNGGAYIAITIRPGQGKDKTKMDQESKLSRKERRRLDCPRF